MDVLSAAFLSLAFNVSDAPNLVERLPPNLRDGLRHSASWRGFSESGSIGFERRTPAVFGVRQLGRPS